MHHLSQHRPKGDVDVVRLDGKMTGAQMDSALEDAVTSIADLLRGQTDADEESATIAREIVSVLGLAVQRQSMPKRLAWAQRTDRPGWYWREDERVECTRLVTPWREVAE